MRIDRRGACLEPHTRRPPRTADRLADHARRRNPGVKDFPSIGSGVATIDATPGEVDDDVCLVDLAVPCTQGRAIPFHHSPGPKLRVPAQDDDIHLIAVKSSRQDRSDLS